LAKIAVFLGNFGFAKIAIYFVPLAIAAFAGPRLYAGIELTQSMGLLIGSLLVGAPLAGVTQHYLVSGERRVADQTALTIALGCAIGLIAYLAALLAGLSEAVLLVTASLGAAVLHQTAVSYFRMLGRRNLTAWFDGTAVLLAGFAMIALLALPRAAQIADLTLAYAAIAVLGTVLGSIWLARSIEPDLRKRIAAAFWTGLPMTVVATLAIWLGVGGRIIVGFLNPEALAAYGVAFRVAGFALGVHQLAVTALFARLYAARTKVADPMIAGFFMVSGLLAATLAIGGQWLPDLMPISALSGDGVAQYRAILPLTALHTFYWIGYGMLQFRVSRSGLAKRAIPPTVAVTLGGIAIIFAVSHFVTNDIETLAWLISAHAAAYFFKNVWLLARRGLPHRWTALAGLAGGAMLVAVAVLV
jgi:hypothetical protein